MIRLLAILGPTASGKSALALALAERAGGEIVSCDSLQVYRHMDVGTGKATPGERARVPHHLLDVVHPDEPFHAARWAAAAARAISAIAARGRLPVVAGGTGLYYRALVRGLFDAPPADPDIRERHRREAEAAGVAVLHARLAALDPGAARAILPGDLVRTSRALEVWEQTGLTMTELRRRTTPALAVRPFAVVLDPPLAALRARVATRVEEMMAAGFLDEVRALRATGYGSAHKPMQALGYRQLGEHLDGRLTLEEAVAETKAATAAYARRQRTWFRREAADLRIPGAPDVEAILARYGASA